jgi:hypothetical protein
VAKLINYQYVKNETDISPNVQDEELDSPIKRSEEMLAMIIGDGLYGELSSQNPNFAGANIALMPYVKKFLAWQAYQFWLPKANFKTHNSGLRVHREDNSEPATDAQMATLIRDAKVWVQTHKERLVAHLDLNHDSFPLYDFHCNTNKRTGTGFHITAVGGHGSHCGCHSCRHGHSQ